MKPYQPAHRRVLRYSVVAALTGCAINSWADAPLRGNPVDSLPQVERPAQAPPPTVAPPPTPEQQAIQARLAQRIVPRNFDVAGVHTIEFSEISAFLTPLVGKEITVGELVQQTEKITELYRERGYPLSFALVQNQNFANGLVVVTVVEGYIQNVRIEGDTGNAQSRLEYLAEPLLEEKPLTRATLERVLNLMRIVPGVTINPAMDLPRRADGATELVINASLKRVNVNGNVADLGTGMQPLVNVGTNSLTPLGEQVKLTGALPIGHNAVTYFAGEVRVPIANDGLALKIDGYHYQAEPQDDAIEMLGFNRKVTNDRIGVALAYPIILNNRRSLTATLGAYAANSKDRYDQKNSDNWLQQDTRVRAGMAELRYIDVLPERTTDVTLGVSHGFSGLGAKKSIETNYGYSADPEIDLRFTRYNLNARQSFELPAKFGLVLSASGQYSSSILPSSEQVSFGSWRYGMGYPQGEISGDKGVGLSAEINRRFGLGWQYLSAVQPYFLMDYARSWYNRADLKPLDNKHLSSLALGLRFTDDRYYLFDFNVAKPVGSATLNDNDRDMRFNANYSLFYDAF